MITTDPTSELNERDGQEAQGFYAPLLDEDIVFEEDVPARPSRWTKSRVLVLLVLLVLLAALVVFVLLPYVESLMNPGSPPALQPPVKV